MAENSVTETPISEAASAAETAPTVVPEPQPTYVKLPMRNKMRKDAKTNIHFPLTDTALLGLLVGLSFLTR